MTCFWTRLSVPFAVWPDQNWIVSNTIHEFVNISENFWKLSEVFFQVKVISNELEYEPVSKIDSELIRSVWNMKPLCNFRNFDELLVGFRRFFHKQWRHFNTFNILFIHLCLISPFSCWHVIRLSHHLVRLMNEWQSLYHSQSMVFCRNFLGLWLLKHWKICIAYRQWRSYFPRRGWKKNRKLRIHWLWW